MKKNVFIILLFLSLHILFSNEIEDLLGVYIPKYLSSERSEMTCSWGAAEFVPFFSLVIDKENDSYFVSIPGDKFSVLSCNLNNNTYEIELQSGPGYPIELLEFEKINNSVFINANHFSSFINDPSAFFHRISSPNLSTQRFISSGIIKANNLRLRDFPNKSGNVLKELSLATEVKIYMRTKDIETLGEYSDYWFYIGLVDGTFGWAYGAFIDTTTDQK